MKAAFRFLRRRGLFQVRELLSQKLSSWQQSCSQPTKLPERALNLLRHTAPQSSGAAGIAEVLRHTKIGSAQPEQVRGHGPSSSLDHTSNLGCVLCPPHPTPEAVSPGSPSSAERRLGPLPAAAACAPLLPQRHRYHPGVPPGLPLSRFRRRSCRRFVAGVLAPTCQHPRERLSQPAS